MVLKIPKKVPRYRLSIKGSPWTIYLVDQKQFDKIHPDLMDTRLCGVSDGDFQSIYLLTEYTRPAVIRTLMHELVHAFLADLDAIKETSKKGDNLIPEEMVAESCAIGFVELLTHINLLTDFVARNIKDVEEDTDDE